MCVRALAQEALRFARTLLFLVMMPISFQGLLCGWQYAKRKFFAPAKSGDVDISVQTMHYCSTACGMIGVLFENPQRWPQLATLMLGACL